MYAELTLPHRQQCCACTAVSLASYATPAHTSYVVALTKPTLQERTRLTKPMLQVFCVHGGLPRELCQPGAQLEMINEIAVPLKVVRRGDMVHSMLWSDPVPPEREAPELQNHLDAQVPPRCFICFLFY